MNKGRQRNGSDGSDKAAAPMSQISGVRRLQQSNSVVGIVPKFGVEVPNEQPLAEVSHLELELGLDKSPEGKKLVVYMNRQISLRWLYSFLLNPVTEFRAVVSSFSILHSFNALWLKKNFAASSLSF